MKAMEERVFKVKNVRNGTELEDVRKELKNQGATIKEETPKSGEWKTMYMERVIWKVKAENRTWEIPTRILTRTGNTVILQQSPTCDNCHSEDHHLANCPWTSILPDIKFKISKMRR